VETAGTPDDVDGPALSTVADSDALGLLEDDTDVILEPETLPQADAMSAPDDSESEVLFDRDNRNLSEDLAEDA
jgi:hypothetical protein